jgi:RING finger protein 113A
MSSRTQTTDQADDEDAADREKLEKIPFKCIICKEDYKNPIQTNCGHYFCEACALKRYKKSPNCAACGAGTGGVFNGARDLKRLLERKRERAEKRRKEAEERREELGEGEDGGGDAG